MEQVITPEEIAKNYSASLDSVTLINTLMAKTTRTAEEKDTVQRNVAHLQLMAAKLYWTTEDLAPLNASIIAGSKA